LRRAESSPEARGRPWPWPSAWPALVIALPLLAIGVSTTHDLHWPADPDLYRDIAQAQTIADGALFADPHYRGEKAWHNPLLPAMVALVSRLTGLPAHVAYVRLGAYVNLLAPLAFYLWVWRLTGTAGAAAATLGFVFYRENWAANWVTAGYSPWLFSITASQPFLYASLIAYHSALVRGGRRRYALVGVLAGLTFLAAAAPALIVAAVVLAGALASALRGRQDARGAIPRLVADHAVMALAAAAVAAPFLYTIAGHYQLHVRNAVPTLWEWASLQTLEVAGRPRWPRLAALGGAMTLLWRARRRPLETVLAASFVLAAAALLAHREALALAGLSFPKLVPAHYFVLYLQAGQWMLVGVLVDRVAALAGRAARRWAPRLASPAPSAACLAALTGAGVAAAWPGYAQRGYFETARRAAVREQERVPANAAFAWIREHTHPDDVFLATESMVLRVVGPAGRKAVLVGDVFSNPYVDWQRRRQAMERLYRTLTHRDGARFRAAAGEFRVTHILSARAEQAWLDDLLESDPPPGLVCVFRSGGVKIWRLDPVSDQSAAARASRTPSESFSARAAMVRDGFTPTAPGRIEPSIT
jgi:hypothetical protein